MCGKLLSSTHDIIQMTQMAMMLDADCDTYTGPAQAQHSLYTSHILLSHIITAYSLWHVTFSYNLQYQQPVISTSVVTGVCEGRDTHIHYKLPSNNISFYHPVNSSWVTGSDVRVTIRQFQTVMLQADTDLTGTLVSR